MAEVPAQWKTLSKKLSDASIAGKLQMSFPSDAKHAPVAGEDLARTVASIISDPAQHIGKVYQLFGPEMLSYTEIGVMIGKILGKDISYEQVSVQEMADSIGLGSSDYFKKHVANTQGDNIFGAPDFNNKIEEITGMPPMSFADFIEKNRLAFTS